MVSTGGHRGGQGHVYRGTGPRRPPCRTAIGGGGADGRYEVMVVVDEVVLMVGMR